ncbi:MAG: hypothetical protein M1834_007534 [Cirrosporium novae-zelandiae]|nr:MAG: hypothetical protein M1834_007534 [Cirrosporium novae-zelandiae]
MPSPFPSSFASAAAGANNHSTDSGSRSISGSGDWSRTRMNGATHTFRRPSLATSTSHQRDSSQNTASTPTSGAAPYVPPHLNTSSPYSRNGASTDTRYTKDQLLSFFRNQKDAGNLEKNLPNLLQGSWNSAGGAANATTNGGSWGRKDDHKEGVIAADVCWDNEGGNAPLGLTDMTEVEKEASTRLYYLTKLQLFNSVNSPLKPPSQAAGKEGIPNNTLGGRKTSLSQMHNSFGVSSPTTARPNPRRRETSESLTSPNPLASPTGTGRFFRDEPNTATPPPALLRRRTDFREGSSEIKIDEKEKDPKNTGDSTSPFASLKRSTTNPVTTDLPASQSPWSAGPTTSGFSPMGAFGNFSLSGNPGPSTLTGDKKSGFGSIRGESRFKGIMGRDSSEDLNARIREKPSLTNLERLPEDEPNPSLPSFGETRANRSYTTESNPFGEEDQRGSAALGGQEFSPPNMRRPDFGIPTSQASIDEMGLSAFGMSQNIPGFREMARQREYLQQTPQAAHHQEPMSPTNTNPYQSPEGERAVDTDDIDTDGSDIQALHLPGLSNLRGEQSFGGLNQIPRGVSAAFEAAASDRSQTSSAGGNRGLPNFGLGAFGGLSQPGGWPMHPGAIGTPTREKSAFASPFGDPLMSSMPELHSPSLATMGGNNLFSSGSPFAVPGTIGRGSKLSSLFPAAMQDQMREDPSRQSNENTSKEPIGSRNLREFGDMEDSIHSSRPGDDSVPAGDQQGLISGSMQNSSFAGSTIIGSPHPSQGGGSQQGSNAPAASESPSMNQLPNQQRREMVMPDRMRWIYRDPQGNTQGPWSGLEMHDWYKAGFFSPELQVKKIEDSDYEPLAQLIRRIGNSREPFLVPQIGVPHGPPNTQPSQYGTPGAPTGGNAPSAGPAQPPFASSFPSFGTTLTAEQQNALERRKQEEQYLMARQKEHLAHQQVMMKQMQHIHGIHPHQLQHHSSAHSLHSQPSFGSITSPSAYQPSPSQAAIQHSQGVPGFFDSVGRPGAAFAGPSGISADPLAGILREDERLLERLNLGRGSQLPFGGSLPFAQSQPETSAHSTQIANMLQDRARLTQEQELFNSLRGSESNEQLGQDDRLRQFQDLRAQHDEEMSQAQEQTTAKPIRPPSPGSDEHTPEDHAEDKTRDESSTAPPYRPDSVPKEPEQLSLTEQVQKAVAAVQKSPQPQSPWAKVDIGMPHPFPPPQSSSPLPAPTAQRNRQNVADTLAAESRSQAATPAADTPSTSIAPWAKEPQEASRGPSLKEIQEAEARKAAQQEEIAAAARRAALAEQDRLNQSAVNAAPAPGLPSTSTWASSGSPATPSSTASAWAKPLANKGAIVPNAPPTKKTLAQIQKEEEAKKQRLAAAASAAHVATPAQQPPSGTKRYADLAGKVAAMPSSAAPGNWVTVGASGKAKGPVTAPIAPAAISGSRSASTSTAPSTTSSVSKPRPVITTTRSVSTAVSSQSKANEEFTKWMKGALGKGLNSSINVDDFVQQLFQLPSEAEIIREAIYANSQALDGNRFAEEFIRRRKLADKGIVESAATSISYASGASAAGKEEKGWSEVAKRGPKEEQQPGLGFKVVNKRKGKR